MFFDILRDDYRCPDNQRLVMITLDELFKLQDSQKNQSLGQKFRDDFERRGGCEILEKLFDDSCIEI